MDGCRDAQKHSIADLKPMIVHLARANEVATDTQTREDDKHTELSIAAAAYARITLFIKSSRSIMIGL